jgi:hypothetical protein
MMCPRLPTLLISMSLAFAPALARASEARLPNEGAVEATLRFSCEKQDPGISIDLDSPPAEFIEQEEMLGVFDAGTPNAFSLHGFTVSTGEKSVRLILDPSYRRAVTDALAALEQTSGDHNLTIIAPKASLQIRWPLASDLIAGLADSYRKSCPQP